MPGISSPTCSLSRHGRIDAIIILLLWLQKNILVFAAVLSLSSCKEKKADDTLMTPWGEVQSTALPTTESFTLQDILSGGEMIMLTLSGPDTYYVEHGREMGLHFLLCEKLAQSMGVGLRVELCRDTTEMVTRLVKGMADVVAFPLPDSTIQTHHLLQPMNDNGYQLTTLNDELAAAIRQWYQPSLLAAVKEEEKQLLTAPRVRRHVFSPIMNRTGGVISKYDDLFRKYASVARCDWRLLAAQCYQESCFDPNAVSWAGARGLMQIMPKTAQHLGLPMENINDPEANIHAAARLIAELTDLFSDIPRTAERQLFVLAAYNGGSGHVRDAMALTQKMGGNSKSWSDVSKHLLLLREPQYYRDPVVRHGYIRSTETYDYVERIQQRFAQYRGVPVGKAVGSVSSPRKATRKHKYHI